MAPIAEYLLYSSICITLVSVFSFFSFFLFFFVHRASYVVLCVCWCACACPKKGGKFAVTTNTIAFELYDTRSVDRSQRSRRRFSVNLTRMYMYTCVLHCVRMRIYTRVRVYRTFTSTITYYTYIYIAVEIHIHICIYTYTIRNTYKNIYIYIYDTCESLDLYNYRTFYVFVHYHYLLHC
mgnify:CR=1 FL=1